MTSEIKAAEKRAYAKGYAAGRKRTEKEDADRLTLYAKTCDAKQLFRRQAYLVALQSFITAPRPWRTNGKQSTSCSEYSRGARVMADIAVKEMFE